MTEILTTSVQKLCAYRDCRKPLIGNTHIFCGDLCKRMERSAKYRTEKLKEIRDEVL